MQPSHRQLIRGCSVFLFCCVAAAALRTASSEDTALSAATEANHTAKAAHPTGNDGRVAIAGIARQAEEKILEALQTKVTRRFEETALSEVVQFLALEGKFPAWIEEAALTEEGISLDHSITAELKEASIEQALNRLLPPRELTWLIEDEVLKITTKVAAQEDSRKLTRTYNVRKLRALTGDKQRRDTAQILGTNRLMFVQFGAGGFGRRLADSEAAEESELAWLPGTIQTHTAGPWQDVDGTGGTLTLIEELLIVRHAYHQHREVAALLHAFEQTADKQLQQAIIEIRPGEYPFNADAAVHEALKRKVTVNYVDSSLYDVVNHLEESAETTMILYGSDLAEEGHATDEPITLSVNDVTLHSTLRLILKPLGLTYYVAEGALHITTEAAEGERLATTVYVVRDLEASGLGGDQLVQAILNETSGPWQGGISGTVSMSVPGILVCRQTSGVQAEIVQLLDAMRGRLAENKTAAESRPAPEEPDPSRFVTRFYPVIGKDRAAALEKALVTFIEPQTWIGVGGRGIVSLIDETLVVRQTVKVHGEIRKFLDELEAAEMAPARPRRGGGVGQF